MAIQILQEQRLPRHAVRVRRIRTRDGLRAQQQRVQIVLSERREDRQPARVGEKRPERPIANGPRNDFVRFQYRQRIVRRDIQHEGLIEWRDVLVDASIEYIVHRPIRRVADADGVG